MDMGQPGQGQQGAVDVGAAASGADAGGEATITIAIGANSVMVNGEPVADIGEALKMVLDLYEQVETPEGDQAQFDAGFGAAPAKAAPPAAAGRPAR